MDAAANESAQQEVPAGSLTIEVYDQPTGYLVVRIAGELDRASAPPLEQELERALAANAEAVVLDLESLEFIDSSGVQCLVRFARGRDGRRLAVIGARGQPRNALRLLGLDQIFPLAGLAVEGFEHRVGLSQRAA
jgi:anti-anti-sigma factor